MMLQVFAGGKRAKVSPDEASQMVARWTRELENSDGVIKVDISCRSWAKDAFYVIKPFLLSVAKDVRYASFADIIAGLMTEEGLEVTQSLDRDWVFTTEAHPIHHVNVRRRDSKTGRIDQLKSRLLKKMKARADGVVDGPMPIREDLENEKWTDSTPAEGFQYQVSAILNETEKAAISKLAASRRVHHGPNFWSFTELIESILMPEQISFDVDFFQETQQRLNAAHLTFNKLGNEQLLTNSCPNFHLSDFRWIRALNGGAVDYTEVYISSAMDKPSPRESRFQLPGSMDALAILGSGMHIGTRIRNTRKRY